MAHWRINPKTGEWEEAYLFSGWQITKGVFWFLVIGSIYSCYDQNIGKRIEISDVEKYCSAEQLLKTGQAKCTEVKWKLSRRYENEIRRDKEQLHKLKDQTSSLAQNKQEKCSQLGLQNYGTEGCSSATKDLDKNKSSIANLTQEIIQKHQRIAEMQLLELYMVNATSLNVRNCKRTNCKVITQLKAGTEVYIDVDTGGNGEWVGLETKKGYGYVMKKYLTPVSDSEIKVDFSDKKEEKVQVIDVEKKSDNVINSSASTQPKTTDFREVNWANASYQDIIGMINAGANINQVYENGTTVLMLAVDMGANPQAIKALIDKGADVNAKNENGYTALHFLSYQENPQLIELLVKNGANINATDSSEMTPLMLAAKDNNNPEMITTLIKSGADINKRSMGDMTAIDYAAYGNKNPKILETLLQQGARADENTFNWAKENENPNVLIFLKKHLEENSKSSKKILGLPIF